MTYEEEGAARSRSSPSTAAGRRGGAGTGKPRATLRWSGTFLPFGAGKHKCIGDRFALTELITAVATIVRQVRFDLPPGQIVRPVARATVRPGTLLMKVAPPYDGKSGLSSSSV
ncbi:hypothetical protein QFZ75_000491 [Streptomyces sp. V3I8]|uniref:cytochrome P450 n=1 Tax=Streptomyces sp. V3I8 TaxID=3042279 RepID=UPI00277DB00D|nr:cytochrome P450 [Streptomyces sp. V3I8]MDQ1034075.1 hypothetical protein [Streptomyces sp. V3I8]